MPKRLTAKTSQKPIVVLISGPNGAGKSTVAPKLLHDALRVTEFLNADLIAKGLSPFNPDGVALEAGRILLQRMDGLAAARISFGMEATLAARTLAGRIDSLLEMGYEFHLLFLYLPSADLAVARVANRVQLGGHDVPETTIRRRYQAGLRNFFSLYRHLATTWQMFDNSSADHTRLIAAGRHLRTTRIAEKELWHRITQEFSS